MQLLVSFRVCCSINEPSKQWQLKHSEVQESRIKLLENFVSKWRNYARSVKENLGLLPSNIHLFWNNRHSESGHYGYILYFIKEHCLVQDLPRVGNSQNTTKNCCNKSDCLCARFMQLTFECLQRPALRQDSPLTNKSGIHQLYR